MTRTIDFWITGFFAVMLISKFHTCKMLKLGSGEYLMGHGDLGSLTMTSSCRLKRAGTLKGYSSLARREKAMLERWCMRKPLPLRIQGRKGSWL
jgi:hypothetical protein